MATIIAPAETGPAAPAAKRELPFFDSAAMKPKTGFWASAFDAALRDPGFKLRWLERLFLRHLLRWFKKTRTVVGYDQVREVLGHSDRFPVPWENTMKKLTDEVNFVLGMPKDAAYEVQYAQIAKAFPLADVAKHVEAASAQVASEIAKRLPRGRAFDAVEAFVMGVPAAITQSYYGVRMPLTASGCPDYVLFTRWTLAASSYVFRADDDEKRDAVGRAGAAHLSHAIRTSIEEQRALPRAGRAPVMDALIEASLDENTIHAILFGMVLGFIPTDVLAGGNMLETLFCNADAMRASRAAALANDDLLLWKCLRETLRFRHINPGPLRECAEATTLGAGGRDPMRIEKGERVWAMTQLGMFDPKRIERPHVFDPDRPDEHYMIFGVGQHWCVGAYIAQAQITQTFKVLLKLPGLRVHGSRTANVRRYMDFYPLHLDMEIAP